MMQSLISACTRPARADCGKGRALTVVRFRTLLFLGCLIAGALPLLAQSSGNYLPMAEHAKWVLRNPNQGAPVVFEIIAPDGDGFHMRSTNPWGSSDWTLTGRDGTFVMPRFGAPGAAMPLSDNPVFLDFNRPAGAKWSNSLGTIEVVSRSTTVKGVTETYRNCIQIRHRPKGGSLLYTFAPGVGFVQFGEGNMAFVLDESASSLPGRRPTKPAPPQAQAPSRLPETQARRGNRPLIGLTFNRFANEPNTPDVLLKRFQQTLDAGITFVVGGANWAELEPKQGQFDLGNVNYLASVASDSHLQVYYSLKIIETIHKGVPRELQNVSWKDPKMQSRVLRLIDALIPAFKGQLRWFTFGYEIDGYLAKHPREVDDFIALYQVAAARVKQLAPAVRVSSTITFPAIGQLEGRFSRLNENADFIGLTYSPLQPDFGVKDPSVLPADFARMRQIARGRKVVLQEITYPSSSVSNSSEEKQAEFYRLAFDQLARDDGTFEALSFMMLADFGDAETEHFANFYGLKTPKFKASMQTLGMFNVEGRPKKGWSVFVKNAQALKSGRTVSQ